jgi:diguanylate cyclase (GGDEF)-like protein
MPDTRTPGRESGRSLYSVAQIQHVLRVEFGRAQRYRYPIVCLVIAIDQLGALRDQHGYEPKEHLFDRIVGLLTDATRASDFLGRTADDRLLAVLPHTGREGARQLAARLFAQVRQLAFEPPLEGTRITLSIGAASNESGASGVAADEPAGMMFHDALIHAAESALAEASAAGGNQLVEKSPT